jgi:shikimate dehydrogenase
MAIDQYAVFGHPIAHSQSPLIHRLFAEQTGQLMEYKAIDVPAESFKHSLTDYLNRNGRGLNCTVPLKELAFQQVDQLTERAKIGRAVNTIIVQDDGTLLGDNTDGIGLVTDLTRNHQITLRNARILILGAGGAARGIIQPIIEQSPCDLYIANRTVSKAQNLAEEFSNIFPVQACGYDNLAGMEFDIVLNATSASLSNQLPPLPDKLVSHPGCCYDLAYGNEDTAFVKWAKKQQVSLCLDGLGMLVEQAAEAFYQWRQLRPETQTVISQLEAQRKKASAKYPG